MIYSPIFFISKDLPYNPHSNDKLRKRNVEGKVIHSLVQKADASESCKDIIQQDLSL